MLKVIVIDDEEIIRRGIANKLRRLISYASIEGEASDGEEGLILTERIQPDIVVTDIKMPKIDGLHFIKKAQEISPNTRFIIISGYEDFSFARQAVRLGVSDYLLKPVDNDELVKAMDGLRAKILREKESVEYLKDLDKKASGSVILKKNQLFSEIIKGEIASEQAIIDKAAALGYVFEYKYFTAMSINIKDMNRQLFTNEMSGLLRFAIANVFEESLHEAGVCVAVEDFDPKQGVAVVFNHENSLPLIYRAIATGMGEIKKYLEVDAYIGIGQSYEKATDLNKSYKESLICVKQKLVFTDKSMIAYSDYEQIRKNNYLLSDEDRRVIILCLSYAAENGIKELINKIDDIFTQVRESKVPYQKVKELCMDILFVTTSEIKRKNTYIYEQLSDSGIESYFEDCRFLGDFQDRICLVLNNLSVHFESESMGGGKKIVAAIKKKMETEYYLDIKLSTFANNYYINQSYLSSLFLQETGRNFSQFLTDIRVEKAKEFLSLTALSVAKVSELVGYNDRSYFCSVFQKAAGISPAKYRLESKVTEK